MISLSGLEALVQVARTGSFAAASEVLGLSSSAVSKSIARLEQSLGVKLLHRTTRSVSLTPDGERLLAGGERILEELRLLESWMGQSRKTPRGLLRLSLPSAIGRNVLVEAMAEFCGLYPEVRLEASFEDRMADLAEEAVDVTVRTGDLSSDNANLIVRRFFHYQTILCAAPDLFGHLPTGLDDLRQLPCLHFRNRANGRIFPWRFQVGDEAVREVFDGPLVFDDGPALARAAVAGAGVALLPTWLCLEDLKSGRLIELLPQHRGAPVPTWLTYLNRRFVSPRVQAFVDFMAAKATVFERSLHYDG